MYRLSSEVGNKPRTFVQTWCLCFSCVPTAAETEPLCSSRRLSVRGAKVRDNEGLQTLRESEKDSAKKKKNPKPLGVAVNSE